MDNSHFNTRKSCPVCESEDKKEIYSNPFLEDPLKKYLEDFYSPQGGIEYNYLQDAKYILSECSNCGLIYQKQILDDYLMNKLYEEWIDPEIVFEKHQKNWEKRSIKHLQEITTVLNWFNANNNLLKFLDYGYGWGEWCSVANALGVDTYGFEVSDSRIEFAKSQGYKIISWDEISDFTFNFINTEQVFEHIANPLETLLHLKSSLSSDGLIKISVPNGEDIHRRLEIMDWEAPKGSDNSLNPVAPLEHINCFNKEAIHNLAEQANLKVVKIPISHASVCVRNWTNLKKAVKDLIRIPYKSYFHPTYVFLTHK